MKVAYIGNTCNNSYSFLKMFRKYGTQGVLYYDQSQHPQTFPESEDPGLLKENPSWLKPLTNGDLGSHPWHSPSFKLLEELKTFDVLHCEDVGLLWAQQSGRPYHWHVYGYDLHNYSFWSYWLTTYTFEHFVAYPEKLTAAIRYRRAISQANSVNVGQWFPYRKKAIDLLRKILPEDRVSHLLFTIDTEKFCPGTTEGMAELLRKTGNNIQVKGLKIFHPTRIMFQSKKEYNYASDKLVRVLRKFTETGREFTLVVIKKENPDEEAFVKLVQELGLEGRVAYIPFQPRNKMIAWYRASDLVTNEFDFGSIGSISLETLACGTALMTAYRTEHDDPNFFMPDFDCAPPVFSANSETDVLNKLILCADNPVLRKQKAIEGRAWVLRNCSDAALFSRYMSIYQSCIRNHPVVTETLYFDEPTSKELQRINNKISGNDLNTALHETALALDKYAESPILLFILETILEKLGFKNLAFFLREQLDDLNIEVRAA